MVWSGQSVWSVWHRAEDPEQSCAVGTKTTEEWHASGVI